MAASFFKNSYLKIFLKLIEARNVLPVPLQFEQRW